MICSSLVGDELETVVNDPGLSVLVELPHDSLDPHADLDLVEFHIDELSGQHHAVMRKLNEDGEAGVIHYGFKFVPDE